MKRTVMTLEQIQLMVARADGWDNVAEWKRDMAKMLGDEFQPYSIYYLVEVDNMAFCRDGVTRWYSFEDDKGRPCIYFRH